MDDKHYNFSEDTYKIALMIFEIIIVPRFSELFTFDNLTLFLVSD